MQIVPSQHETYIRGRFAGAPVITAPFPHVVVRDVLPPDVYAQIEAAAPPRFATARGPDRSRPWRRSSIQIDMRDADADLSRYAGYVDMIDALAIEAMRSLINPYLDRLERGRLISNRTIKAGQVLFCQRPFRWWIGPHTHDLGQIVQSLIYFPMLGSRKNQGTVLYSVKPGVTAKASEFNQTRTYGPTELIGKTLIPYQKNTLFSFLNTPASPHGNDHSLFAKRRYIFSCSILEHWQPTTDGGRSFVIDQPAIETFASLPSRSNDPSTAL